MTIDEPIISNALRHYIYLHEHPETSFQEYQTSIYIQQQLEKHQIHFETVGTTGIIALMKGQDTSRTIALRADMDALPITENPEHPHASLYPGVMHACGHDLHTACLLGTAEQLNQNQASLPTNIMLIFQHAEEVLPGGAAEIIQSDFFNTYLPEWIIGQHSEPDLPLGTIGICPGQYMASGDEIYITLRGPGGHAALPDQTPDLVLIASHIVVALQQIASRKASPLTPTVLTFGNIRCHSAMNIIPKEITLEGTFRTFNETWRTQAKQHIREIAGAIARSMGAEIEIRIIEGYPSLYNDPVKAEQSIQILESTFGNDRIVRLTKRMTTEDFARYSQIIPATFLRLGVQGQTPSGKLHTPDFHPDPLALKYGIQTLCTLATSNINPS